MLKPLLGFLLTISSALSATQEPITEPTQEATPCYFSQPILEFKAGYFFFSNSKLRKIYDRGGLDIQLCGSYPWNLSKRWSISAYGAVEYFRRSGRSLNEHQKTSIWSIPVNIGLMPAYAINPNMHYYFAIGPRYFYIHQRNHSSLIDKNESKNGIGFFVNTGFNYVLWQHFLLDVFGEYSFAKAHFHGEKSRAYSRTIQIGGFTFGGGLGYKF